MSYYTYEDTFPLIKEFGVPDKDLAEFGIYNGNSFKRLLDGAKSVGKPFRKAWGFDVFKGGLPAETNGVYINPEWVLGAFDVSRDFNLDSVEEAVEFVRNRVGYINTIYVSGYFKETLTSDMADQIGNRQISYLSVDTDIHSSSKQVLDFVFTYKLLCEGCLIRFDDILSTPANGGQKLALAQTVNSYRPVLSQFSPCVYQLIKYEK